MSNSRKKKAVTNDDTVPTAFVPSQEQIDAFARRLMPEIKKFFADENIRQEFIEWQDKHSAVD
jgi:hypothetical protein